MNISWILLTTLLQLPSNPDYNEYGERVWGILAGNRLPLIVPHVARPSGGFESSLYLDGLSSFFPEQGLLFMDSQGFFLGGYALPLNTNKSKLIPIKDLLANLEHATKPDLTIEDIAYISPSDTHAGLLWYPTGKSQQAAVVPANQTGSMRWRLFLGNPSRDFDSIAFVNVDTFPVDVKVIYYDKDFQSLGESSLTSQVAVQAKATAVVAGPGVPVPAHCVQVMIEATGLIHLVGLRSYQDESGGAIWTAQATAFQNEPPIDVILDASPLEVTPNTLVTLTFGGKHWGKYGCEFTSSEDSENALEFRGIGTDRENFNIFMTFSGFYTDSKIRMKLEGPGGIEERVFDVKVLNSGTSKAATYPVSLQQTEKIGPSFKFLSYHGNQVRETVLQPGMKPKLIQE